MATHGSRRTRAEIMATAVAELADALTAKGFVVSTVASADSIEVSLPGAASFEIGIEATAVVTEQWVRRHTNARSDHPTVVVADVIPEPMRSLLTERGCGWLDLRGHLYLRWGSILVDTQLASTGRHDSDPHLVAQARPITGVAGITWAATLLLGTGESMRAVARRISISHSAIVAASQRLRSAALVTEQGRPVLPHLFTALADVWSVQRVPLASLPEVSDHVYGDIGVHDDLSRPGWAVTDTVGAIAWGAPVFSRSASPPDFYVPSQEALRRAVRRLGRATGPDDTACTVAVPPTPIVCQDRVIRPTSPRPEWPVASWLYVALDLAQDGGRGDEILAGWNPKEFTRVW